MFLGSRETLAPYRLVDAQPSGKGGTVGQSYEEEMPTTFDLLIPGEENAAAFPPAFLS